MFGKDSFHCEAYLTLDTLTQSTLYDGTIITLSKKEKNCGLWSCKIDDPLMSHDESAAQSRDEVKWSASVCLSVALSPDFLKLSLMNMTEATFT